MYIYVHIYVLTHVYISTSKIPYIYVHLMTLLVKVYLLVSGFVYLSHMCGMTHLFNMSHTYVIRLIYIYVARSFRCVTCLIHVYFARLNHSCDMPDSCVWNSYSYV